MPLDPETAASAVRKLKLAAAVRPAVIGDPDTYREALAAQTEASIAPGIAGTHDWILLFAADRASLEQGLIDASAALESPGTLWVAYPKGTSKVQADLTRDQGWDAVRGTDLMWLALISIDETWSAFSFRHHKPGEARQTFR